MSTNIEKLIAVGDISFTVVREGSTIDLSVSNAQSVDLNGTEALSVTVGMSRDGTPVELDNPFQFVRPYVEVRGTETYMDGEYELFRPVENPTEALKAMVLTALQLSQE